MNKQRNLSLDIKTGFVVIDEALEHIKVGRVKEKKEQKNLRPALEPCTEDDCWSEPNTPKQKKRLATSPAENQEVTPAEKKGWINWNNIHGPKYKTKLRDKTTKP